MNLSLNTIVNQTGNMKPDQTLYLRQDDTLGKASGLGRLARLFSGPRQAENRASVERLKQAVASHPEFKNLLSDSAIKHFFTQKLASGTALTVGEVEALKADLDTLNTLQVGRALVRSGVLPEGFAKDFAIFTASHQLPLKTAMEQLKALRDYYKENLLPGLLRGACRKAGVSQGYLDKAVDMIRATDEFREYSEKLFSGETKNLNFTLAPKALALMPALAGNPNTLGTLPQDKVPAIFNSLVEMARAGEIAPDRAKAFLDFCTERGLSLSQPLERHRALGVWLLEPRAEKENWGADLAEKMKLPPDVGRTVANMPEVNGQILAKLLAPPSAPPTRELVEQAAKEVMTGFLKEKGEIINKFLKINQSVPKDLQEMLYFPPGSLSEARLQTLLGSLLAGDALLDKILAPSEKQTGLSLDLAEAALALARAEEIGTQNFLDKGWKAFPRQEDSEHFYDNYERSTLTLNLPGDALLLLMHHRGLDESALAGAIRQHLKPLHQNVAALEKELADGRIGGLQAQQLKKDLGAMRRVLYTMGYQAYRLDGNDNPNDDPSEWAAGDPSKVHQSVRDLAGLYGVKMDRVGYEETSALITGEMAAWFGPAGAPASAAPLFADEARRLGEEIGLIGLQKMDPGNLPLDALAARANSALGAAPAPLSPEQARGIVRQVVREQLEGLKGAFDYLESLPLTHATLARALPVKSGISPYEKTLLSQIIVANNITSPVLIEATVDASRKMARALDGLPLVDMNRESMVKAMYSMGSDSLAIINAAQTDKKGELERPRVLGAALMLALASPPNTPVAGEAVDAQKTQALYAFLTSSEGQSLAGDFLALAEEAKRRPETSYMEGSLSNSVEVMNLTRQILGQGLGQGLDDPNFESPTYYNKATHLHQIPGRVYEQTMGPIRFLPDLPDLAGRAALSTARPPLSWAQWDRLRPLMETVAGGFNRALCNEQDAVLKFVAGHSQEILTAMNGKGGDTLTATELWRVIFGKTEKAPANLSAANLGRNIYITAATRLYSLAKAAAPDKSDDQFRNQALQEQCGQGLGLGLPLAKLEGLFRPGGRITLEDFRRDSLLLMSSMGSINETNDFGLSTDFHRRQSKGGISKLLEVDVHTEVTEVERQVVKVGGGASTWLEVDVSTEVTEVEREVKVGPAAITLVGKDGRETRVTNEGLTLENSQGHDKHKKIIGKCREICGSEPQFHRVMQCFSQASTALIKIMTEWIPGAGVGEHTHCNMTAKEQENGEVVVTIENPKDIKTTHYRMQFTVGRDGEGRLTALELVRPRQLPLN